MAEMMIATIMVENDSCTSAKRIKQVVDATTEVTGNQTDDDTEHQLQRHRKQTDGEGDTGAIEDGAPDIPPLVVGAEPEALLAAFEPGGGQLGIHQIKTGLVIDVVRGEPGGQQAPPAQIPRTPQS